MGEKLERAGTVICRRGGQFLLVRQRMRWSLPGGMLRAGEAPRECAQRELGEETGLTARLLLYLWEFTGFSKRHYVFLAELEKDAQAQPLNEIRSCRWFHPSDKPTLLLSVPTRSILGLVSDHGDLLDTRGTMQFSTDEDTDECKSST
ncbi:NUDIX hydrolase (plasmid) [Paraburkholderia hospita]|nr:NUDIX hydrolase [Paraburkholderia hospita]